MHQSLPTSQALKQTSGVGPVSVLTDGALHSTVLRK